MPAATATTQPVGAPSVRGGSVVLDVPLSQATQPRRKNDEVAALREQLLQAHATIDKQARTAEELQEKLRDAQVGSNALKVLLREAKAHYEREHANLEARFVRMQLEAAGKDKAIASRDEELAAKTDEIATLNNELWDMRRELEAEQQTTLTEGLNRALPPSKTNSKSKSKSKRKSRKQADLDQHPETPGPALGDRTPNTLFPFVSGTGSIRALYIRNARTLLAQSPGHEVFLARKNFGWSEFGHVGYLLAVTKRFKKGRWAERPGAKERNPLKELVAAYHGKGYYFGTFLIAEPAILSTHDFEALSPREKTLVYSMTGYDHADIDPAERAMIPLRYKRGELVVRKTELRRVGYERAIADSIFEAAAAAAAADAEGAEKDSEQEDEEL